MPADTRARLAENLPRIAESMAAPRAEGVLALINARASSPTAQEIRNVLAPRSRPPVMAYEHTESPAEGRGCYELDVLAGAGLWREALVLATEAGLSINPLD